VNVLGHARGLDRLSARRSRAASSSTSPSSSGYGALIAQHMLALALVNCFASYRRSH